MRLELAIHPVTDIDLSTETKLQGATLQVDLQELRRLILEDQRLQSVDIETARPGESCRIGVVFDILEPRAKEPGSGSDFPGILGPYAVAGQGTTHVLRGVAVTVLDEGSPPSGGKLLEMSGPAAAASPFGSLLHLVVAPHAVPGLERHTVLNALRGASVTAATYLARAALGQPPAATEVLELPGPTLSGRESLPRVAYIGQIQSRQRVAEVNEQILYGSNTVGMVPLPLHPNEWLDGALACAYMNMGMETYLYQNHAVITELYRRHQAGEINFVGTIATVAASDGEDRNRNCMLAAHLAKWNLGADVVVLTKFGGGAPHSDMAETARLCEAIGIATAVAVTDMSGDRRAESALLFNFPEINAIVYNGGNDTRWKVTPVDRIIAGSPEAARALAALQEITAGNVCGVTNQQGASRLRSVVY